MQKYKRQCLLVMLLSLLSALAWADSVPVKITAKYPHDAAAFTQGLLIYNNLLYESTGLYGKSNLRKNRLKTGQILQHKKLSNQHFGEGLARVGQRLYQLTWQEGIVWVYDVQSFKTLKSFNYAGEGWGLTYDGEYLIHSNGSAMLAFRRPKDFSVVHKVTVTDLGQPLKNINELEYINGEVWANIRFKDVIARINPQTGEVIGWVDAHVLRQYVPKTAGVLNGIAWDAANKRLFLTGKNWPWLFEVEVAGVNAKN